MHSLIHVEHARAVAQEKIPRERHVMRAQHPPSPRARRGAARLLVRVALRLDPEVRSRALVR
ncbi:MAG: hypothetical protein JWN32_4115 [Solirubrobacterales bacterium]|jgi:hypothetical protein|nr:hypothetical protein [Solirubrobacterales bacterium]